MGSESETMKRGKNATGKLSLFHLSVRDALRPVARLTLSGA